MGSLSRMNAKNRLTQAIEQRIAAASEKEDYEELVRELVEELGACAKSTDINEVAAHVATDPHTIDFPAGSDCPSKPPEGENK
jgi:hypothetical protein